MPPGVAGDLGLLPRLPVEAQQKLWTVLVPALADRMTKQTEELLDMFCAAYRVDEDELGRAVKACRFVIREAAKRDLPASAVAQDLERLCPDTPLVRDLVLAGYEQAKAQLRHEIVKAAVAEHGKLLVGLRWRLDTVEASERGAHLQMPLALLTLHYLEGGERSQVTLQVLPDMMSELKAACGHVLDDSARSGRP
ncbi:MAG TPA: hypothetical protein VGG39_32655 [Polyangiaceae bacterium]